VLDVAFGKRKNINIFGVDYDTPDGSCVRDYIHVCDLAEAHIIALEHLLNGGKSGAFNLGNGFGFSVKEVIETATTVTGKEIPYQVGRRRAGDPPILIGDSERITKLLGWRQKHDDLAKIIETAWTWQKVLNEKYIKNR